MKKLTLCGLVSAVHTPFKADGSLHLPSVETQAHHLLQHGIATVFICGSTGESQSLTTDERLKLAERWLQVAKGTPLKVMVHVGSNSLPDAQILAKQAGELGAVAISAIAPYYFKIPTLERLVGWCKEIAASATTTPFYFYDIPGLTGTNYSMPDFLPLAAKHIPTFNGIKFSGNDLLAYQLCVNQGDGAFDMPWGADEAYICAHILGAKASLGSTSNFAAPVFQRMLAAVANGDLENARKEHRRLADLINLLFGYGYMSASKQIMTWLGVDVGQCRMPLPNLNMEQTKKLQFELEACGFFDWSRPCKGKNLLATVKD